MTVLPDRLSSVTRLYPGSHHPDGDMCVMEAVAYVAGEPWSDHPSCASVVLTEFAINLNDWGDDERRQRLLPLVPRIVGTAGDGKDEARLHLAISFACDEAESVLPLFEERFPTDDRPRKAVEAARAWLDAPNDARAAGATARAAGAAGAAEAAGDVAWDAARDAAWAAAWVAKAAAGAARDAAWAAGAAAQAAAWAGRAAAGAARDAAGAARDAAWAAAWVAKAAAGAARDAAWDAARAAAWDRIFDLFVRMVEL